ncbi:adenine-specific DNA-methyltransferase [Oryzisolibacter propanilivorax]|uniref:Adenine-specific DNA-methyltransferase n=1 Tax=Oryzisolibacter propanilivorax TaxID=1527607 RepID=A0A1G9S3F0_9BURK|nr:adenine-specific DNA-methyltransferase [Oryzisolibacter propanilivorax]
MRVQNARALRQQPTDAERLLWRHLRAQQLGQHKSRRQHPIGPYFADFACVAARLIVELDGGQHAHGDGLAHDQQRTQFLQSQSWRVLRFWNHQMLGETDAVLQVIAQALTDPHPSPLPHAGEGVEIQGHTS